jgi:hypothetical protein
MGVCGFIGLGLVAVALGLLGWQGYEYMRYGISYSISTAALMANVGLPELSNWIAAPKDWFGLHKLLSSVPAWISSLILGFAIWIADLFAPS